MELLLTRHTYTDNSTIGTISHNGVNLCYVLEDHDRGLDASMSEEYIREQKVYGKTAIPSGSYEVTITYSERFKKPLPLILNVKGFTGIRIHPGNFPANTDGCLLPGTDAGVDAVYNSRVAFVSLASEIQEAMKAEKVFLTIIRKS